VGSVFGGANWAHYSKLSVGAPTGTVVIAALLVTMGFHLLLAALDLDMRSIPNEPLNAGPLAAPSVEIETGYAARGGR
jgi:hypothetical protein